MRISDWSSDVCSSDLAGPKIFRAPALRDQVDRLGRAAGEDNFLLAPTDEARPAPPRRRIGERHFGRAERTSVVSGKSVSVRVDLGGRRIMKKENTKLTIYVTTYSLTDNKQHTS